MLRIVHIFMLWLVVGCGIFSGEEDVGGALYVLSLDVPEGEDLFGSLNAFSFGLRFRARWRPGRVGLPTQGSPESRVLGQEFMQDGCAGAGEPHDEDGLFDALFPYFGVGAVSLHQMEPVLEQVQDVTAQDVQDAARTYLSGSPVTGLLKHAEPVKETRTGTAGSAEAKGKS